MIASDDLRETYRNKDYVTFAVVICDETMRNMIVRDIMCIIASNSGTVNTRGTLSFALEQSLLWASHSTGASTYSVREDNLLAGWRLDLPMVRRRC